MEWPQEICLHPKNMAEIKQFCKEDFSKIPPEHCLIHSYRKHLVEVIACCLIFVSMFRVIYIIDVFFVGDPRALILPDGNKAAVVECMFIDISSLFSIPFLGIFILLAWRKQMIICLCQCFLKAFPLLLLHRLTF